MVDHQDKRSIEGSVTRAHHLRAGHDMLGRQYIRPAGDEDIAVDFLMRLDPRGNIGAVGHALDVHNLGAWLVERGEAYLAQAKGKVGVLEISRRVARIEPAQPREERSAHHQRGTGTIIDRAYVVVFGPGRVIAASVIPAAGIIPDDAAGFLQAAIRIEKLGADRASIRASPHQVHHRIKPAGAGLRIVVEEHQVFADGPFCCFVAGTQESQIARLADQPDAPDARELSDLGIGRGIIDDDHLDRRGWGGGRDRRQTAQRACGLAVGWDDHRDRGLLIARHSDPIRCRHAEQGVRRVPCRAIVPSRVPGAPPEANAVRQLQGQCPPEQPANAARQHQMARIAARQTLADAQDHQGGSGLDCIVYLLAPDRLKPGKQRVVPAPCRTHLYPCAPH